MEGAGGYGIVKNFLKPGITVVTDLTKRGTRIKIYDPQAYKMAKRYLAHKIMRMDIGYGE